MCNNWLPHLKFHIVGEFGKNGWIKILAKKVWQMNTVDVERFCELNVCGFNPIEVFAEILVCCLGQKCLLFSILKRCLYSQENFGGTLDDCKKHGGLAQRIFPCLR